MRHRNSNRKLGKTSSHRKAMFKNLVISLVEHEHIITTVPKAKELRRIIEPLITIAREDTVANRRLVYSRTTCRKTVTKLFNVLAKRYANRTGGYTRALKCGFRAGDNAPIAFMELVDRTL